MPPPLLIAPTLFLNTPAHTPQQHHNTHANAHNNQPASINTYQMTAHSTQQHKKQPPLAQVSAQVWAQAPQSPHKTSTRHTETARNRQETARKSHQSPTSRRSDTQKGQNKRALYPGPAQITRKKLEMKGFCFVLVLLKSLLLENASCFGANKTNNSGTF